MCECMCVSACVCVHVCVCECMCVCMCCTVPGCSVVSSSLQPHGLQPSRILCPRVFSRQEYCSGLPCPLPGDLPNPRIEPRSPVLQADCLPSKLPGKPKNTGMGSLSLLQGIFSIQELNWDLLLCMWILYQLSCQGSPCVCINIYKICINTYICVVG